MANPQRRAARLPTATEWLLSTDQQHYSSAISLEKRRPRRDVAGVHEIINGIGDGRGGMRAKWTSV